MTYPDQDRRHHIGYYLISRGRFGLEQAIAYPPTVRERTSRFIFAHPAFGYLGTIVFVAGLILALPLLLESALGVPLPALLALGLLAFIPASDLAVAVQCL